MCWVGGGVHDVSVTLANYIFMYSCIILYSHIFIQPHIHTATYSYSHVFIQPHIHTATDVSYDVHTCMSPSSSLSSHAHIHSFTHAHIHSHTHLFFVYVHYMKLHETLYTQMRIMSIGLQQA